MFGFATKRRHRTSLSIEAVSVPEQADAEPAVPSSHAELLQRWMSLADMQQRVIQVLAGEITRTSSFVETEADSLSERFQRLAVSAQQQTARVESLTSLAMGIEVEGKTIRIDEVTKLFEGTLSEVVAKILLLSKDSMSMVYALGVLDANVQNIEKCIEHIDSVNATTKMLALNARIEAERAGSAGAAFRVVANEVRDLSKTTQTLAATMTREIRAITDGIKSGHATLQRIATVDMTDNLLVKDRLEVLLTALVHRNSHLEVIVGDAVKEAETISSDVDGMVTGIQFQDRTRQRLEHVVDTLHVIDQALEQIKQSTVAEVPGLAAASNSDMQWIKSLLSGFTMSEMRERFVAQILDGNSVDQSDTVADTTGPSSSGSMELF